MADETPVPVPAPASEPSATATPPPPPPPAPDQLEDRARPPADLFRAMLDQTTDRRQGSAEDAEEPADKPRRPAPPAVTAAAAAAGAVAETAAPGPKKWADRFDSPEVLEREFQALDAARTRQDTELQRSQQAAQRLERLLLATLEAQKGGTPAPDARPAVTHPVAAPDRDAAFQMVKEEIERMGLADPAASPERYVRALAHAIRHDPEARQALADLAMQEFAARTAQEKQLETVQTAFFTQYPDLKPVRQDLLRRVAETVEARLARASPDTYGSPEFMKQWFEETAREARASLRVEVGEAPAAAAGSPASVPRPRGGSEVARGAPFSESPSPRASEPVLTGQALHLARVFGRGA